MNDVSPFDVQKQQASSSLKKHIDDKFRAIERDDYIVTLVEMSFQTFMQAMAFGYTGTYDQEGCHQCLTADANIDASVPEGEIRLKKMRHIYSKKDVDVPQEKQ